MIFDLHWLEVFYNIYNLKSFSKAAKQLNLTQPTISAHLASLEKALNIKLFDRLGKNILATQAAHCLYEYVQQAFTILKKAELHLATLQGEVSGTLKIRASNIPSQYILPKLLAKFIALYPNVNLDFKTRDSGEVIKDILNAECMVGIIGSSCNYSEIETKALIDDELIIVGKHSYLKNKPELKLQNLTELPWVIREPYSGTRDIFIKELEQVGIHFNQLQIKAKVYTNQGALAMAEAGLGFTAVSRISAQEFLENGKLKELHIPKLNLHRSFFAVRHAKRQPFPLELAFWDFLFKHCQLKA